MGSRLFSNTTNLLGGHDFADPLARRKVAEVITPEDARRLGIRPHAWVRLESRRAEIRARAFLTHAIRPGELFVPMHYAETNQLTVAAFDPHSRQPAYKACAVSVRPDDP